MSNTVTATSIKADSMELAANPSASVTWQQDYISLTKPRITLMILLTVGVSMFAATRIRDLNVSWLVWLNTLIATGLIAASASTLNQWFERDRDAMMPRTRNRPLPSGRLTSIEVSIFGWLLGIVGCLYLWMGVNREAMLCGLATWAIYCWVYTPMKVHTWWNTAIGTLPGALPVMIGWTGAGGSVFDVEGWALTMIVILWQFPHFMAIAWLYREQYAQAGFRMLTKEEPSGVAAGWHAIVPALLLVPLSVYVLHPMSAVTWMVAIMGAVACMGQAAAAYRFLRDRNDQTARKLLRSSLVYLPAIMMLVVVRWSCI
ncbi:MAG: heme o synthase [Pirellula sp.]